MIENGLSEMKIWLANRITDEQYFFYKNFAEVGDKQEAWCGKFCQEYNPRNGKSGACKHYGNTYEQTDITFTIKLSEELINTLDNEK